jgi:hypothetical protein
MTYDVLAAIQEVGDMTSLHHYQHMTMARVGHDALLRGAELMKLRVADVERSADGKAVTLHIHPHDTAAEVSAALAFFSKVAQP